jgi:hypothetical protein
MAGATDKTYTQTVTGKSAAVPVYLRRGYWGGRVGLGRGWGWRRGYYGGWRGYGWGRPVGLGLGYGATGGRYYGGSYRATHRGCGCNPCGCGGLFGGLFSGLF